jgi:thioredoxin-related protein
VAVFDPNFWAQKYFNGALRHYKLLIMNKLTVVALIAAISMMGFAAQFEEAVYVPKTFHMPDSIPGEDKNKATEMRWYSWSEASELQKTKPRKLFIDVYTDWCGWCKRMDKNTFSDPKVAAYLAENFYPIKLDAEQKEDIVFGRDTFKYVTMDNGRGVHTLAYSLLDGRMGYPSIVMLDEQYRRIMISPGYKEVADIMPELTFAAEQHYDSLSWDQYKTRY